MAPEERLTQKDARDFLALDEKTFTNYFRFASEFNCLEREGRGRFYFSRAALEEWKAGYEWRTIELTFEDYLLCLDFALAMHFRGYVQSDWSTGRQREFGQKITNWVKGQLAEVAVKKFFQDKFHKGIELDFGIHSEIVPQDIIGVHEGGAVRAPRIGVGIKASKPKNAYLVLGDNEISRPERRSDYYIYCRPDIPDDHLLRLTKDRIVRVVEGQPHFASYREKIPGFENIPCEIAGWCRREELETATRIPGQDFDGVRWVRQSGLLRRDRASWEALISEL